MRRIGDRRDQPPGVVVGAIENQSRHRRLRLVVGLSDISSLPSVQVRGPRRGLAAVICGTALLRHVRNLAPLCRRHDRAKQARSWRLTQLEPGTMVWVTPSGRSYATGPTAYPG
jgi:hypothetical protein